MGPYESTVPIGGVTRQYSYFTRSIEVRSGVDVDNSGNLQVLEQNPNRDGIVFTYPARGVDEITVSLKLGSDRMIVDGGVGNDRISTFVSGPAAIYGGSGEDTIFGSDVDDMIWAGSGEDFVDAGAGNDFVHGGNQNDDSIAGPGHDIVQGGGGSDYLEGNSGIDIMIGSSLSLPVSDWPEPDDRGIIFSERELRELLVNFHFNDRAADTIRGGSERDLVVWHRFQDSINFRDPFPWWINRLFGSVARDNSFDHQKSTGIDFELIPVPFSNCPSPSFLILQHQRSVFGFNNMLQHVFHNLTRTTSCRLVVELNRESDFTRESLNSY